MARDRSGSEKDRRSVSRQRDALGEGVEEAEEAARGLVDRAKQFFGLRIPTRPIQDPGGGVDLTPPDEEDEGRDRDRDPTPQIVPGPPGGGPPANPGPPGDPPEPGDPGVPIEPPEPDPEPPDPDPDPPDDPSPPPGGIADPGDPTDPDPDPPDPSPALVNVTGCSGVPSEASPGAFINVDINLENRGGIDAEGDLTVTLGGDTVVSETVDVDAGANGEPHTVGFNVPNQPGDYTLSAELGNIGRQ